MTGKKRTPSRRFEIAIEVDGKPYKGFYEVEKGVITVYGNDGSICSPTLLGNSPPELLAKILLREMVQA